MRAAPFYGRAADGFPLLSSEVGDWPAMELDGRAATADDVGALALRNYGHFTSMRVENSSVRGLGLHLERLVRDCGIVHGAELDADHVRQLVRQAVANSTQPVVVRVTVFDPSLDLGQPGGTLEPQVLASVRPVSVGPLPPIRLGTVLYQRELPDVKHVGLFGAVYHRRAAQLRGYDDGLFLSPERQIVEGPTWNIGFYNGSRIVLPGTPGFLPGITQGLLLGTPCAARAGSVRLTLDGLTDMRAAFITNAAIGVRAVESINGTGFAGDPAFIERLQDSYAAIPAEPL